LGSRVSWAAFSSTSLDKKQSLDFAHGKYNATQACGVPVRFIINTSDRGAPILDWSKYPQEDEVLLEPFQCFTVLDVEWRRYSGRARDTLTVKLCTV